MRGWRIDERLALCVRKEDGKVGDQLGDLYGKVIFTYDQPLPGVMLRAKGRWLALHGMLHLFCSLDTVRLEEKKMPVCERCCPAETLCGGGYVTAQRRMIGWLGSAA